MRLIIRAVNAFCNDPKLRRKFLAYRWPLAFGASVLLFFLLKPQYFWLGFFVSLAGEVLQVWCFASLNKKKELAVHGPYALVRNPMYIGRYFVILGAVAMTGSLFLIGFFSLGYYFYMVNRVAREEEVLKDIFGVVYAEYCARTPRFLPAFGRLFDREALAYFRWDLFFRNHAHRNLLGVLIGYLVVFLILFFEGMLTLPS